MPLQQDIFSDKPLSQTTALIGAIVRVWEDTPDQAIVPCTDDNDKRFELVFDYGRKPLFDAQTLPAFAALTDGQENPTMTLTVTGFWRKRMWKKTRTTGGWGHTWQFVVASWSHNDAAGVPLTLGAVPAGAVITDTSLAAAA